MIGAIQRLDVLWRVPGHRRFRVGVLSCEDDGTYRFDYVDAAELAEAQLAGFKEIPGLAVAGGATIRSRRLFATFAQRLPSRNRPDFARLMSDWNVSDPSDEFEILARSGGLLLTDHLELCEHRELDDDLSIPLSFVVAGMRYGDDNEASRAKVGDLAVLQRELDNPDDLHAVLVLSSDLRLGHVPRQYSRLVASLLCASMPLRAVLERKLLVPHEGPRWVVRAWNTALHRVA